MTKIKYTDETIFEVRGLLATGITHRRIRARLGISLTTISHIKLGKRLPTVEMLEKASKPSALSLFKMGNDYLAIGSFLNLTEAEVEKQIHAERKAAIRQAAIREQRRVYQQDWNLRHREEMARWRARA